MEFNSREAVIKTVKDYTIHRGVDYQIYEFEPMTFYVKCVQHRASCDWLIRLDSNTIAKAIRPLVVADPSIKVRSVIADIQSKFNYTISYCKAWLVKQKVVKNIFGGWEASYEALPIWFEAMVAKEPSAAVEYGTLPCYHGDELAQDVRVLNRVFWSFYPYIRAFRHCKSIVQVDGAHFNNNIVLIAFVIIEGATLDAWFFFLRHLQTHVVTRDEFKAPFMQKLVVNIGYSKTRDKYEMRYQWLHARGEAYTWWLDRIPCQWHDLAYDGGHRWGHMTTNLGAHNLPVTALVKVTFYRLNELFTRKRAKAESRIRAGHLFSESVTKKIQAKSDRCWKHYGELLW
ncbi:hypothetical protein Ahy_B08g091614 isoform A [Arachis hypogaea]|uniref:Transposase MuDR plant domain-containing protein n=1 Tax=Arachis hypogaea TaxID=3818 RepID=A0A444Y2D6_ARAHY|nr:hypothetical protein Ahy_B08g091614 isoform A [Arachis hypogaea]